MLAPTKTRSVLYPCPFRWMARTAATIVTVIWLAFFINEVMRPGFGDTSTSTFGQAVSLAVVFAGYAIGYRTELAGGITAIIGTLAFFAVVLATTSTLPDLPALFFVIPGVLYLLAWHYDERRLQL
jgi:hypothetical protein